MQLRSDQKDYIKKSTQRLSPEQIASDLSIPKQEVLNYLQKKWRVEKYQKYIGRYSDNSQLKSFGFNQFFWDNRLWFGILFLLITVVYFNSLNNALVSDDIGAIMNNPGIGIFSNIWSSFGGILQRTIYYLIYHLFGTTPIYYRLFNIFFHIGSVFVIFTIFNILYNKKVLAFMTAALFAVHPILIESVAWISGHPYVQNSFFFLCSFLFYLLSKKNQRYFYVSIVLFIFSLSSSERGFVLCSIFFLYELLFGNLRIYWKRTIPFFVTAGIVAASVLGKIGYRVSVLQSDFYLAPGKDSLLIKIPTSIATYFKLIFWPNQLSLYQTEMVFTPWQYRLTVVVFLAYMGLIIYGYFKNKPLSFWLLFFIIPLSPTLSPLRIAWAVAERYAYLSTLGILAVIAWIFYKLSEQKNLKVPIYVIFSVLIIALSARTITRNMDWKSEESLWFATEKTSPSGPNIHNNVGTLYFQKGEYDKAIQEMQLAIQINPGYADAYHNLGNIYYQKQDLQLAANAYSKALEINPRLWQSHQNLAAIYYGQGWYDLAQKEIQKAIEINPTDNNLKKNLALIEQVLPSMAPLSATPPPAN